MDLVNGIPRSPYESMYGIVFLPRAIDKVRAEIDGKLGDYISRTFFSGILLEFLGIEPQDFVDAVAARDSDDEVWAWVKARMTPRSATEVMAFNRKMMTITPWDDATAASATGSSWPTSASRTARTSPASSTAWTWTKTATSRWVAASNPRPVTRALSPGGEGSSEPVGVRSPLSPWRPLQVAQRSLKARPLLPPLKACGRGLG